MRTLEQGEIDALLSNAEADQGAREVLAKNIVPYDVRRSNQLTQGQISAVTTLHETLARRLSNSLAAYLRVAFEMTLVSVEQLSYSEFLSRLPELTYFASVHVMPTDARAALQLDISLVYPIIDVALGGSGSETIDLRDLTDIEEQILESILRLMLRDLQSTWAPVLELEFQFEQRQQNIQNTMESREKILCLSFKAHLAEHSGTLAMVFPAVVANALLRRLSAHLSHSERIPSRDSRRRIREQLLDCCFVADLSLPNSPLTIRQLIELQPGSVLTLPRRASDPIQLKIAGRPMFLAYPVRYNAHRGAKIEGRASLLGQNAKKKE